MNKTTIFLMLTLSLFTFNIAEASFPITKKVVTENVNSSEDNSNFLDDAKSLIAPSAASDIEWGAFLVGFLLGIIGVLLVWIFGGDTSSAWKGLGAWLILLLLLLL